MVELQGVDSAYKADAMAIATAFQNASDEDQRLVMNGMSNSTTLSSVKFYAVHEKWFRKAFPLLTARSAGRIEEGWRQSIGIIENAGLLATAGDDGTSADNTVSSDEDDQEGRQAREGDQQSIEHILKKRRDFIASNQHTKQQQQQQQGEQKPSSMSNCMKKGLIHKRDFFLLGPNSWLLIKEKFGFDNVEIERFCVQVIERPGVIAVKLKDFEVEKGKSSLIQIPASGRFAYEKIINHSNSSNSNAADVVSEEEEEGLQTKNQNVSQFPTDANVASDDNDPANPQSEDEPVLLLPASEPSDSQASNNRNLYPSFDAMELDSAKGDKGSSTAGRKRYASGLGNLGNTCFMNSTVQCLAHTEPLRRYFLSGEYESELNRDNPLGTGGDLATQFANLLSEMWGTPPKRRNIMGSNSYSYSSTSSTAVYPRDFKYTLGKHAEQFMGYDQHDSQELATYLLDALHEDTNRISKKPYIEKPEQGEDEPDEVAASKAWDLHLKREDSRVLENFMGQVKSRVQCCEDGCQRVSTTFDPFMYLSVPIPGATDVTLKVVFVPIDPNEHMKNISVTLNKNSTMGVLLGHVNEELVNYSIRSEPIPLENLVAVDVWSNEVYSWYTVKSEIDRIRETDHTYIYEVRSVEEIRQMSQSTDEDETENVTIQPRTKNRSQSIKLDLESIIRLNREDEWKTVLKKYLMQPIHLQSMFFATLAKVGETSEFLRKLDHFIDRCHKELSEEEQTGVKRAREEIDSGESQTEGPQSSLEDTVQALVDLSDSVQTFCNVKSRRDVAILDFCAGKVYQFIQGLIKQKKSKLKDGVAVQIIMRHKSSNGMSQISRNAAFVAPLVIRIPPTMTVYGLREELARRLSRSLKAYDTSRRTSGDENSGESSAEAGEQTGVNSDLPLDPPALLTMRQIPMSYDKKRSYDSKTSYASSGKLGMIEPALPKSKEGNRPIVLASPSDESEQATVADIVGVNGTIFLDWPSDICDSSFDDKEYETADDVNIRPKGEKNNGGKKSISVVDCIDKYCQMEQLEDTEMWYCNRCKKHVRAWKQFHLYRSPPILIVHLKRFHYSATTHRRDKIVTFIDFPLEGLDLTEKFSHWTEDERPIYDCYAVSNHYGGLGGGHYTAYTLSDEGKWCHYDDSRVTTDIDQTEVVSEAAYVLYYRRRDVLIGQDMIETQTPAVVQETGDNGRDTSEVSSNNTAEAGDDVMDVDAPDASSVGFASDRTYPSPMGSVEAGEGGYDDDDYNTKPASSSGPGSYALQ